VTYHRRYADNIMSASARGRRPAAFLDPCASRLGEFALDATSGQDPPDRVRPPMRRRTASGAAASRRPSIFRFTFICGKSRRGKFSSEENRPDRMRASCNHQAGVAARRHQPDPVQGKWLRQSSRATSLSRRATNSRSWLHSASFVTNSGSDRSGDQSERRRLLQADYAVGQRLAPETDTLHPGLNTLRRSTQGGSRMRKAARTVLCGGPLSMSVPTAIALQ